MKMKKIVSILFAFIFCFSMMSTTIEAAEELSDYTGFGKTISISGYEDDELIYAFTASTGFVVLSNRVAVTGKWCTFTSQNSKYDIEMSVYTYEYEKVAYIDYIVKFKLKSETTYDVDGYVVSGDRYGNVKWSKFIG